MDGKLEFSLNPYFATGMDTPQFLSGMLGPLSLFSSYFRLPQHDSQQSSY